MKKYGIILCNYMHNKLYERVFLRAYYVCYYVCSCVISSKKVFLRVYYACSCIILKFYMYRCLKFPKPPKCLLRIYTMYSYLVCIYLE